MPHMMRSHVLTVTHMLMMSHLLPFIRLGIYYAEYALLKGLRGEGRNRNLKTKSIRDIYVRLVLSQR